MLRMRVQSMPRPGGIRTSRTRTRAFSRRTSNLSGSSSTGSKSFSSDKVYLLVTAGKPLFICRFV
jgi:hypothetical protein